MTDPNEKKEGECTENAACTEASPCVATAETVTEEAGAPVVDEQIVNGEATPDQAA